jgi:hypothetical protein
MPKSIQPRPARLPTLVRAEARRKIRLNQRIFDIGQSGLIEIRSTTGLFSIIYLHQSIDDHQRVVGDSPLNRYCYG